MVSRLFITASLSTGKKREFNEAVAAVAESAGFSIYLPQRALPYGGNIPTQTIYSENILALQNCDGVVCLLNDCGSGVEFELGYAVAALKEVIILA